MWAASPETEPDGHQARRPRARAIALALTVTALSFFGASCASAAPADTAPTVSIELLACDLLGASDIVVFVEGLPNGVFTASVSADGSAVPGVDPAAVSAAESTVLFADLPNGGDYLVSVDDSQGSTIAAASATLPICDLPTLDDPAENEGSTPDGGAAGAPRTLAATGMPVAALAMLGLGALQAGALAAGVGYLRRREG